MDRGVQSLLCAAVNIRLVKDLSWLWSGALVKGELEGFCNGSATTDRDKLTANQLTASKLTADNADWLKRAILNIFLLSPEPSCPHPHFVTKSLRRNHCNEIVASRSVDLARFATRLNRSFSNFNAIRSIMLRITAIQPRSAQALAAPVYVNWICLVLLQAFTASSVAFNSKFFFLNVFLIQKARFECPSFKRSSFSSSLRNQRKI